jgi:MFS transporter, YQGE family, putative transporter
MRLFANMDRMDREAWLLLLTSSLFFMATSLSSTFVNVYLFKMEEDWVLISMFNLIQYFMTAVTFALGGWLIKKRDRVMAIRLGVAVLALFYLGVWWLGARSVDWFSALGVIIGLGSGFYWLAYHVMYFEITEKENRDVFNGLHGFCTSAGGIVAPFVSGLLISKMGELKGYRLIFGISLIIFLCAVLVSFFFRSRKARGNYALRSVLALARDRETDWFWVNLAMTGQGFREGVFAFLLGLLFFVIVKSELALGSFYTVSSAMSCLSFFIVSRYLRPDLRNRYMLVGAWMMGLAAVPFVFQPNEWTIWILGVGVSLFYPLYLSPMTAIVFDVIGQSGETAKYKVEYVVSREMALNLGRMAGVLLFAGWVQSSTSLSSIRWFVLVISFVQIFAWWAMRKIPVQKRVENHAWRM